VCCLVPVPPSISLKYALFSSAPAPMHGPGCDVRDVQEQWINAKDEARGDLEYCCHAVVTDLFFMLL
jgi:hypothetical protein